MWTGVNSIGSILAFYSLGWWVILCACMAIYGVFRLRGVKRYMVGNASFLIVFFSVCIIYTALSVLFMYRTGREELVSAMGILQWAVRYVILFFAVYYLVTRLKNEKARKIATAVVFAAVFYVAADGVRVMLVSEKYYGCAAQAEEKAEEKRLAEQRGKEKKSGVATPDELSVAAISTMYYPHFWERFFKASQCPE